MEALLVAAISPLAAAEIFVATMLSWICFNIHKTLRDPKTPAEGVLLVLGVSPATVTAVVFWFSASLRILFSRATTPSVLKASGLDGRAKRPEG
jgi:hypothetical protein